MSKNYVELKVSELRDECKNRSLDTSGLKVHLVERLNKYDRELLIKNKTEVKPTSVNTNEPVNVEKNDDIDTSTHSDQNNVITSQTPMENDNPVILNTEDKVIAKEDRKRPHSNELSTTELKKENLFNLASNELDNWENRTDAHLDFYNSDINLVIDENGYLGTPLHENGFEYMCAGVKGNYGFKSGKIFFEVKILKKLKVELNSDAGESNFIRIGWSTDNESLSLGEGTLSFGYDGIGKKVSEGNFSDYGIKFDEGSVVGCFLEFNGDCFVIRYSVNGINQGEAFNILSRELKEHMLVPHIYTKNVTFEVNFGQNDNEPFFSPKTETEESQSIDDLTWTLLGKVNLNQRTRALMPPKAKSDCEVSMMCGLPGCGKTHWTEKQTKEHPEKRFNVLSVNTILEKMKVINLRKKVSSSRWDSFISYATNCLNKLMEIAVSRRRNFILDQTNVYPSAQRRRMKPFEEFIRKAIIIVPTDDEYQRRMNQVIQEEGKDVPESAVLQLKENFVIPEENSDLFNEIIFIELQRPEAEELIKKYNEEAKNHKKKDTNSDAKSRRDSDDESYGKWSNSPKAASEDNEPTAPKKSRWNDQLENRKDSKNRERHDRSSPERLPRKNDYKGGFCFSREASDSGKGSNRFNDGGFRSDDRHNDKSRDQRGDRSGNRSNALQYRKSGDNNDRRPKFDRDDSKFGNRNPMGGGNRDSRPRDRGSESRGGSQFQGRDRPRGGYNDRRPVNSYDDGDSRNKFPQSNYNDRSGMNMSNYPNQERNNRFPQSMPERNDFRGRGRGAPMGNQNASFGKESFLDRRNVPENREYQNYSEFNPYPDNRQTNMPWQSDYKNDAMENTRRPQGFDNSSRAGNLTGNYDQQFGAARSAVGLPLSRGKSNDKSNQYNERKTSNVRGGQSNRGGRGVPSLIDIPQNDDYSYGSNKNYDASKFGNKNYPDLSAGSYKEPLRSEMSYTSAKPNRGGYSKFGETQKSANAYESKVDSSSCDYTGMLQSTPYENYQSYDNSQYNQNQGYYNYYTGDSNKEQAVGTGSNFSTMNSTSRSGYQSTYLSGNLSGGSTYQSSTHPSSNSLGGSGYQSSNPTSGTGYQSSNYLSSNTQSGSSDYQSNYPTGGTGYQSNYQSSNPTSGTGYQSNYHSSNPTSGTGYQSSYQSSNPTSGTGYQSSYHSSNPTSGTGYQSSYQSSNPTSGSNYQSSNTTSGSNYTNPYNAIYENTSSYNSSYYGQTNTYAQSGNYGDNTVPSKFSDYSSKPPTDRTIPPPAVTTLPTPQASSTGQAQASWGTGYGEYSQYYGGQYYGN